MELFVTADKILTLDASNRTVSALHVRGDGIIREVGDARAITRHVPPGTPHADFPGCTIIPSFIDGHQHFSYGAFEPLQVDCSTPPISSLSVVLDCLERAAAASEPGRWVRGWGVPLVARDRLRNLTLAELDRIAPSNPLVLMDASYHGCFVNTLALERAGIDKHSGAGRSGIIVYDQNGDPTGALLESASDRPGALSWQAVPDASDRRGDPADRREREAAPSGGHHLGQRRSRDPRGACLVPRGGRPRAVAAVHP